MLMLHEESQRKSKITSTFACGKRSFTVKNHAYRLIRPIVASSTNQQSSRPVERPVNATTLPSRQEAPARDPAHNRLKREASVLKIEDDEIKPDVSSATASTSQPPPAKRRCSSCKCRDLHPSLADGSVPMPLFGSFQDMDPFMFAWNIKQMSECNGHSQVTRSWCAGLVKKVSALRTLHLHLR